MSPHTKTIDFYDERSNDQSYIQHDVSTTNSCCYDQKRTSLSLPSRKSVKFAPNAEEVFEIIHINDLKKIVDVDTLWFSTKEYDDIIYDIRRTVRSMESGKSYFKNENDQCTRGLESMTTEGRKSKRRQVLSGLVSVLEEQELQRIEGINDPDLLADIFFEATYPCQYTAEQKGDQDSKEVVF